MKPVSKNVDRDIAMQLLQATYKDKKFDYFGRDVYHRIQRPVNRLIQDELFSAIHATLGGFRRLR
jgi:hypothetical protein